MADSIQRMIAMARLTLKAAFRFKLIPWLFLMLGLAVLLIPYVIRHDGSAEMFAQVQLSYSLLATTTLLAASTIWLSCGILNRDLERHHITLLASKPIARWEIWLGRWLGIFCLNTSLIMGVGVAIYGLLLFHSKDLSPEEQVQLNRVVLTSRASASEAPPDEEGEIDQLYESRSQQTDIANMDASVVREQLREEVRWMNQLVKPLHRRLWTIPVGKQGGHPEEETLQLRVKFYAAPDAETTSFPMIWIIGDPNSPTRWEKELDLAPMTTHEWSVPASLIRADGMLQVECRNYTDLSLVFKVEDGLEVLYRDGGFLFNYLKGLAVLLAWMSLLAALGLWAATFASLPVATFLILTMLLVLSSENLFRSIVTEGTISAVDEHTGKASWQYLDWIMVPLFTMLYHFTETLRSMAPIERLVTGRSIPTGAWILHLLLVGGILIGSTAGWGMLLFNRKELNHT